MILGIGTDLVQVSRMERIVEKEASLQRLFTPLELDYARGRRDFTETCAGLFAAKEALGKALGCGLGGLGFHDVEILHQEGGAPEVLLHGAALEKMKAMGGKRMHLSIAHDGDFAQAVALMEGMDHREWEKEDAWPRKES